MLRQMNGSKFEVSLSYNVRLCPKNTTLTKANKKATTFFPDVYNTGILLLLIHFQLFLVFILLFQDRINAEQINIGDPGISHCTSLWCTT